MWWTVRIVIVALLLTMSLMVTEGAVSEPVELRTVARGALSAIQKYSHEVIRDAAGWEQWWRRHSGNALKPVPPPKVDFSREMVIAVTLGRKTTGGYRIEVAGVREQDGALRVSIKRRSPPPGSMNLQMLTAPFHVVALPRSDLKVVWSGDEPPSESGAPTR